MHLKILILLVLVTSLGGYLEWGGNQHLFLIQAEVDVIQKLASDPLSVIHPLTLLPLLGQLILVSTLFQTRPSKLRIYLGIGCLALLIGLMFFIGIISINFRILASTLPFLVVSGITILQTRRM